MTIDLQSIGDQIFEYIVDAILASLRVGGPQSIEEIFDLHGEGTAIDGSVTIAEARSFVYGIEVALGLSRSEVLELQSHPDFTWRQISADCLDSINAERARHGLKLLVTSPPT